MARVLKLLQPLQKRRVIYGVGAELDSDEFSDPSEPDRLVSQGVAEWGKSTRGGKKISRQAEQENVVPAPPEIPDLQSKNAQDAREILDGIMDIPTLTRLETQEQQGKNRKTVLGKIKAQIQEFG